MSLLNQTSLLFYDKELPFLLKYSLWCGLLLLEQRKLPRIITVLNYVEIRLAGLGAHSERHDSDDKDQV